jgi:Carboxypeptidase regulatory-like domain/TonB dependent receptor-like, beta-barrel
VKPVRVLGLVCAVLACAHASPAQQSVDLASIGGRVVDPSGAVVRGAEVTARHAATNVTAKTNTDADGRFRFPYLKIGSYVVTVHHAGFREAAQSLTLSAGAAFELPISLEVGGVNTDVVVTAETTVLEAARSQITGTIPENEVRNLPLNGRNFLDAALLVPGVSPTNVPATQMFPETSAVPGVGLSVSSQRNLSNSFVVDGLSANDDAAALSGITYGVDAIEQFQVVTSGGQAELGRALGGYVNIVTKSGTNSVHGSVYDFVRDDRLNAPNPLIDRTLPMSQSQFGGSVGGPLLKNRTFYFSNVEQRLLDQSGLVTILEPAVAAINARLAAVGYQGPGVATGVFPITLRSTNVLGKIEHQAGARDQFSLRYSLYRLDSDNSRNAGALNAPSTATDVDNLDQTVALANTLLLSSRTVLETRAQLALSDFTAPPVDPVGPAVSIAGVASFGTSSGNPAGRRNTLYQVVNNLSYQTGGHALRLGVDFIYNDDRIVYPRAFRGSYSFSSLANFLAGVYNNTGFTQTFGAFDVSQTNPNLALHAQDEWKVTSRITVNAGVRYDLQWLETVETDASNLSPRVGVVWSPLAARRTIVRGNAGIFYDRVPLRAVANALLSAGNTTDVSQLRQIAISLSPAQASAPVFPAILASSVPSGTLPSLTTMDRQLQSAYSRQGSVEVEQQIGARGTVSAGYHYVGGERLLMSINQNVPSCVASGTNNGCRPNPNYANNSQYSSAGTSTYHGLHVSLLHRPARWGQYRVSYTLSKAMNNVGEFFFSSPIDPFDLSKDWGRSDNDQRHRLVVNGTLHTRMEAPRSGWEHLTNGFQVSGTLQAYSALPLNITSGVTTIQGTAGRPVVDGEFIPRNAGVGSDFLSVNLRVSRAFHFNDRVQLEALGEVFNLTNRQNVLTRNANFGSGAYPTNPSPTFGQVTAVGEPRSFQIGARLRF